MIFSVPPIKFNEYLSVTKPYILLALKNLLKFVTEDYMSSYCVQGTS